MPLAPRTLLSALLVAWAIMLAAPAQAANVALLVGISNYGHSRYNLEGPANDVAALRDVLIARWGFEPGQVRTLLDAQATKPGIMAALRALMQRSAPGDDVLIYFSGHGTSALDGRLTPPVPHGSGAMIAHGIDFSSPEKALEGLIIGKTDLRPVIQALEQGGRRLWVISDSCFAGQQVRSLARPGAGQLPGRMIPMLIDPKQVADQAHNEAQAMGRPSSSEPYPYRATAYLAASAEGEIAKDIPRNKLQDFPTVDGKPHGALTDALLRVLKGEIAADFNRDGLLDLNEVHRAVSEFMAQRAYGHSPQRLPAVAEDRHGLGVRAVLATPRAAAQPREAAPQPLRVRAMNLPPALESTVSAVPDVQLDSTGAAEVHLNARADKLLFTTAAGDAVAELAVSDGPRIQAQLQQLAWAKRMRQIAQRHSRGTLAFEIEPNRFGGNLKVGELMHFVARPDRPAWLVVLNIQSDGLVSVLYPNRGGEMQALPANTARAVPGDTGNQRVQVQAPVGMDMQFAFAFDSRPAGLHDLKNVTDVPPTDPRLLRLEQALAAMSGQFTSAQTELRVSAPAP